MQLHGLLLRGAFLMRDHVVRFIELDLLLGDSVSSVSIVGLEGLVLGDEISEGKILATYLIFEVAVGVFKSSDDVLEGMLLVEELLNPNLLQVERMSGRMEMLDQLPESDLIRKFCDGIVE